MIKHRNIGKKGDKIISIYWFAVLFIVAAAIVYMVVSFYGKPYDARETEVNILTGKIASCLSEAGYLKEGVLAPEFKNNFLERCRLNFQTEDIYGWREQEQYYIEANVSSFSSGQMISSVSAGNRNLREFCNQGKNSPVCLERILYSLDKTNNQYKINILSIVRKTEKNAQ